MDNSRLLSPLTFFFAKNVKSFSKISYFLFFACFSDDDIRQNCPLRENATLRPPPVRVYHDFFNSFLFSDFPFEYGKDRDFRPVHSFFPLPSNIIR